MAKNFNDPFDDVQSVFDKVIKTTQLEALGVKIKVLGDDTLKEIYKTTKSNPLLKHETGNDIYVFINEVIFGQLTDEQQVMVVEESLGGVHYDDTKDTTVVTQPDVKTYSGILKKYSYDEYEVLKESIKTLFAAQNEK